MNIRPYLPAFFVLTVAVGSVMHGFRVGGLMATLPGGGVRPVSLPRPASENLP